MGECRNLFDLCRATAHRHGNQIALQHGAHQLSYSELLACAQACGVYLRSQGLGPGQTAALLLENSLEYAIALLGIFTAGATAVPLSPDTTQSTLHPILRDCSPRVLISRSRVLEHLSNQMALPKTIAFGASFEETREMLKGSGEAAMVGSGEDDAAMVLYTSGTTGRPKGVVLSHGNLLANSSSIIEYLRLTCDDSIVNVLPFFHSFGNSVLLTHLAVGGKVIIENRFAFPSKVVEVMQSMRPTGFSGVPTTFYILIHKTSFLQQEWGFFRYISQAGGGMRAETIRRLRQALPKTKIFIMYGQTEASARLSYLPPEFLEKKLGSIGKPIPGVELRVVDENGRTVECGQIGEIVARGPNIMRGYLNDPAGTAEALRDGWLRTGDTARFDEDGFLFIVGRKADFIKSAAYRISPGEIEEVIAASAPGIEDVAVIGVPDQLLGEAIAACVCCARERFDPERIRKFCTERLPLYKVPKYVVHETEIPRTASGKKKYFLLREKYRDLESGAS